MKLKYRQRLFLYFAVLFSLFTLGIIVFEQTREKGYKTQALEEKLEAYTDIIQAQIGQNHLGLQENMNQITSVLPPDLRITLIGKEGEVLYDNSVEDYTHLSNHKNRPEIIGAYDFGKGSDIRLSHTNQKKYLYFAKNAGQILIRVALPYDIQLQNFLKSDNVSLYFILLSFAVFLFFIHVATNRFSKMILQLRDYVLSAGKMDVLQLHFPNDEIGEIGSKIADHFHLLREGKKNILLEKQKLLQHIQVLEEGICFFSANQEVAFHNGLFIQNLNYLTDEPISDAAAILKDANFRKLQEFLSQSEQHYFEEVIQKQGKFFSLRANIFEDKSYEVILSDITKIEKTKQLKQEMTGNIAHELRTPITSIRAYLETVLHQDVAEDKKQYFIERAFQQTLVLSDIIQDMSLIAKMEEASDLLGLEKVKLDSLLSAIQETVQSNLDTKKMTIQWGSSLDTTIFANKNLLYALFKNLIENAIRYAGEGTNISIDIYKEDAEFYYFSFYDTGIGIQNEAHLNRIFERFYRINEGRTRDTGGSGLGLSIVKNAVLFHKGKILVKNRKEGGLEFLFAIKRFPAPVLN